ncbi:MAG: hypothetical protein VB102_08270 [Paludibacter sp.]|nr:hypothetical protein [Paludibacter sp.]
MNINKFLFTFTIALSLKLLMPVQANALTIITLDGTNLGRSYDGLGAVESYGKLLYDYPEKQRDEILDYLFLPNYGASLQILKMTIGCDGNDVGGSWPSHKRNLEESPDYNRGYGWWMMKEARKRNPDIQLSALNWGYPGWATTDELKAEFIFEYVKGARDKHGLILNHIGGNQNESEIRPGVTKLLRQKLDAAGLENVKIIAADEGALTLKFNVISALQNDPDYAAAVDIVGVHYKSRTGDDPIMNGIFDFGKPVWSTEDGGGSYKTKTAGYGWVSQIMKLLHDVKITGIIRWLTTASAYENMPWSTNGFMKTNEPWSGRYVIGTNLWAFSHFTQFIKIGSRMLVTPDTYLYADGTTKGGRYIAYKSPDSGDYSMVIDTYEGSFPAEGLDVEIYPEGDLSKEDVAIWRSNFNATNESFIRVATTGIVDNKISVHLDKGCIYTISTTRGQNKGVTVSPAYQDFPIPYTEVFENYQTGDLPKYFVNANGAFEIAAAGGGRTGKVLRQTATKSAILWHPNAKPVAQPLTAIGNIYWTNYDVQVDVLLEEAGRVLLGGRIDGEQVNTGDYEVQGYWLMLNNSGSWVLYRKDVGENFVILKTGAITGFGINKWTTMKLSFKDDSISVYIGDVLRAVVNDTTYPKGHVAIATMDTKATGLIMQTSDYVTAQFDNLQIGYGTSEKQTVYYVSPDGDDANSGLSPESRLRTIKRVFDLEVPPSTHADILINVAEGTYATSQITPALDRPAKVTLMGESAATTIVESASTADFRFFQLQPATNAGLELNIRNMTMQNFGRTDNSWAGAIVMMNGSGNNIKTRFARCAFKNNLACRAAIIQSSNASYEVSFENCYFENCKSFDLGTNSSNLEAMIYITGGIFSVKNCVFNNNTKNPLFGSTDRDLKKGSLITLNPANSKITATIINNTFVNNKTQSGSETAVSVQPAITIADLSVPKKAYGIDLNMVNNLFVENRRSGFVNDADVYVDPVDVTLIATNNNIFNKILTTNGNVFFSEVTNKISPTYTLTSAEINFEMNGTMPEVITPENGVSYVLAKGTEILGKGVSKEVNTEVPDYDIKDVTRKTTPDIGATDYSPIGSSIFSPYLCDIKVSAVGKSLIVQSESSEFSVQISDITGRQLYAFDVSSDSFIRTFDLNGIFLVTVVSESGIVSRKIWL